MITPFLTFSDSAKYAQAAKNILNEGELNITHSFFDPALLFSYQEGQTFKASFQPLVSYVLSLFFRFLPPTDATMALVGLIFFSLSLLLVFQITSRFYGKLAAVIAALFFALNQHFLEYTYNFSAEILFSFLILFFAYLIIRSSRTRIFSLIPLWLMFLARPQAVLFVLAFLLASLPFVYQYFLRSKHKILIILGIVTISIITYRFVQPRFYLLSFGGGFFGSLHISPNHAQGDYLRGLQYELLRPTQIISKTVYNIYNFLKYQDRLVSPLIFFIFLIGIFLSSENRSVLFLKRFSFLSLIILIGAASMTLPNVRYIQPAIPLILIVAAGTLVQLTHALKLGPFFILFSTFFILLPSIGSLTLDARFNSHLINSSKPPVYKQISKVMADHIQKGQLIITNLDAWAAWYYDLTTMWFPTSPNLLEGHQHNIPYIVMTNYQEYDADFALGEWSEVVYSPHNLKNKWLKENYSVLTTFEIKASTVYENRAYQGTILIRNDLKTKNNRTN